MAPILTFKSKTYPAEVVHRAEIINVNESKPPLANIFEMTEMPATPIEITFECKKVQKAEKSAISLGRVSLVNDNLDESDSNKNAVAPIENGATMKNDVDLNANLPVSGGTAKADTSANWQREKTYDGSLIYRVMTTDDSFYFIQYSSSVNAC